MGARASKSTPAPPVGAIPTAPPLPLNSRKRINNAKKPSNLNRIERSVVPTAPPLPTIKLQKKSEIVGLDDEYIKLKINGIDTILYQNDCIKFDRNVFTQYYTNIEKHETIAKILNFKNDNGNVIGIFYMPWRDKEKRWASSFNPKYQISLEDLNSKNSEAASIKKLERCPDFHNNLPAGGRMKTRKRRATKKAYKNKRRHSRRN
jgi:hypothetical protein